MQKPVLVIKLGTAVISGADGKTDTDIIKKLSEQVAALSKSFNIVLVSSGAVASGKAFIKNYKATLTERKAAAAVGNPILITLYQKYLSGFGLTVAQALCERHHFSNRSQFLQLKQTFAEFWNNNIIPVVNENDLVSNVELKFSDNDELSTLIAIGFDAETLIICTSAGGFLDNNNIIIPVIHRIDSEILSYAKKEKSAAGLGGMLSKITFTRLAASLGIKVIMSGLSGENPLVAALSGKQGTTFTPKKSNLKARQKWLASGSITIGSMQIDKGAEKALANRKSLLTVGVQNVEGTFAAGEVVQLISEDKNIIGVAKARSNSAEMSQLLSAKNVLAAHADDIVLF